MIRRSLLAALTGASMMLAPVLPVSAAVASQTVAVAGSVAAPKACKATVSNAAPQQYSKVTVTVTGLGSGAKVTTSAKYKTTTNKKTATASAKGKATTVYSIGRATKGFRVVVSVTAKKGSTTWNCSTAFRTK